MPSLCLAEDAVLVNDGASPSFGDSVAGQHVQNWRGGLFERLDEVEIDLVRRIVSASGSPGLQRLTRTVTWLGNGWLYSLIAVLLACLEPSLALRLLTAGGLSAIVCFAAYPILKKRIARQRPFCFDPSIEATSKPLDYYSFPSGHCMAATAVAVPLGIGVPGMLVAVIIAWTLIAWSRVSSGHHFPTDVLFGAVIGAAIALPITLAVL